MGWDRRDRRRFLSRWMYTAMKVAYDEKRFDDDWLTEVEYNESETSNSDDR
jgi:hypothetical protein